MLKVDEIVRACRMREELTQTELAKRCGLHPNTICFYENGVRVPNVYDFEAVLNACGLELVVRKKAKK